MQSAVTHQPSQPSAAASSVEQDEHQGSPLFWMHHALQYGLMAERLQRLSMRRSAGADRLALIYGRAELHTNAERCWRNFCGDHAEAAS